MRRQPLGQEDKKEAKLRVTAYEQRFSEDSATMRKNHQLLERQRSLLPEGANQRWATLCLHTSSRRATFVGRNLALNKRALSMRRAALRTDPVLPYTLLNTVTSILRTGVSKGGGHPLPESR